MDLISPATLALVSKALDAASLRQAVHASNIAHAHAQGFVPSGVRFESELAAVRATLDRAEPLPLAALQHLEAQVHHLPPGSSVELDVEVGAMAQNSLHYQALLKGLSGELALLSLAVTDGRR